MVTEQVGPQGKDGWAKDINEGRGRCTNKPQVPVGHASTGRVHRRVYDTLARDRDDRMRLAACYIHKEYKYAAQREYRFAILNERAGEETVSLQISGMMRDPLRRTERLTEWEMKEDDKGCPKISRIASRTGFAIKSPALFASPLGSSRQASLGN